MIDPLDPVLASIQVGIPTSRGTAEAAEPFDQSWTSGIFKTPIDGPVFVGLEHLSGDQQADLVNHGGANKAVCAYSADHYDEWRETPGLEAMTYGGFGENLSIEGLTEDGVCIGDIWSVGGVLVQVSQPRQPCWKLARKWRIKDLPDRVIASGRTGWYFRVLREGFVERGATLGLVERSRPDWTVTAANQVMHGRPFDLPATAALLTVGPLSESWKVTLAKRLGERAPYFARPL